MNMNNGELVFYLVLVSMSCVIAFYWALYGYFELGLQRPLKKIPLVAAFIGMGAVIASGYLQRYGLLELNILTQKNMTTAAAYLFTPPLVLMILVRLLFIKSGIPEYNMAVSATNHWAMTGMIEFGHILEEPGTMLRKFPRAIKALEYFDKAIGAQKKGTLRLSVTSDFPLADREPDYDGLYTCSCPACNFSVKVPSSTLGVNGECGMCGSCLTAKQIGDVIYISAMGKRVEKAVLSITNKANIAAALEKKSLLLRMMNRLDEAEQACNEASRFIREALSDNPQNKELMILKRAITFRAAEIAHVSGEGCKAKVLYSECLVLDESIGYVFENPLIENLIANL